jgi:hypothetical protein
MILEKYEEGAEEAAPSTEELLDAYMRNAYSSFAAMTESIQGLSRLSGGRPEIIPSLNNAQTRLEESYLWLRNAAAGVHNIISKQGAGDGEEVSDK